MVLEQLNIYMEKNEVEFLPHTTSNINLKYIIGLYVKFCDLRYIQRAQQQKKKINEKDFIQTTFVLQMILIKEKGIAQNGGKKHFQIIYPLRELYPGYV